MGTLTSSRSPREIAPIGHIILNPHPTPIFDLLSWGGTLNLPFPRMMPPAQGAPGFLHLSPFWTVENSAANLGITVDGIGTHDWFFLTEELPFCAVMHMTACDNCIPFQLQ